jgi:tetratricopeptide (TPR) repeat protein
MNNRIEELLQMRDQDPDDPFLWYVLALEYVKSGDPIVAEKAFDAVLERFPDYLPAYYQAAVFFWDQGSFEKARYAFGQGIILAEASGDMKTLQELRNSYQNFQIDLDEI